MTDEKLLIELNRHKDGERVVAKFMVESWPFAHEVPEHLAAYAVMCGMEVDHRAVGRWRRTHYFRLSGTTAQLRKVMERKVAVIQEYEL